MTIVIKKTDSLNEIKAKLEKAEKKADELKKKEIMDLCGVLKGRFKVNPVTFIRKMRDEEWS